MSDVDLEEVESYSFGERFLMVICGYRFLLHMAFVFEVVFLLFSMLSFFFADLNESTQMILYLDFALLGAATVPTVTLLYLCSRAAR